MLRFGGVGGRLFTNTLFTGFEIRTRFVSCVAQHRKRLALEMGVLLRAVAAVAGVIFVRFRPLFANNVAQPRADTSTPSTRECPLTSESPSAQSTMFWIARLENVRAEAGGAREESM